MHRATLVVAALIGFIAVAAGLEDYNGVLLVDDFEGEVTEEGLPKGWEPLHFDGIPRHTVYSVRRDEEDNAYLHAEAEAAASGLVKETEFDLEDYPVLAWRWRIGSTLEKGDARTKAGDDYAARVYVNFEYDPERVGLLTRARYALARRRHGEYPPLHTRNYIWANRLDVGTFLPNAYTDRAMMVAVQSGDERAGEWIQERRNVYEDYKEAFGEEPTRVIGVAVMTDTDDTGETTWGAYDDIRFLTLEAARRLDD